MFNRLPKYAPFLILTIAVAIAGCLLIANMPVALGNSTPETVTFKIIASAAAEYVHVTYRENNGLPEDYYRDPSVPCDDFLVDDQISFTLDKGTPVYMEGHGFFGWTIGLYQVKVHSATPYTTYEPIKDTSGEYEEWEGSPFFNTDFHPVYLRIVDPPSLDDGATPPEDGWTGPGPYHFKWQWVVEGTPGEYENDIEGIVTPSACISAPWPYDDFDYRWSVDVGEFEDHDEGYPGKKTGTTTPVFKPTEDGTGTLRFTTKAGSQWGNQSRFIEVYEDHLARDYANFGTGISCDTDWEFERYDMTIEMGSQWNCHGSVNHGYDGSGTGSAGALHGEILSRSKNIHDAPINWTTVNSQIQAGDVVAFYSGTAPNLTLQHSHTCLSGGSMYGANNEATSGNETWIWDTCSSQEWWSTAGTNNDPPYPDCTRLVIFNK